MPQAEEIAGLRHRKTLSACSVGEGNSGEPRFELEQIGTELSGTAAREVFASFPGARVRKIRRVAQSGNRSAT
jgi:hypothetical protein